MYEKKYFETFNKGNKLQLLLQFHRRLNVLGLQETIMGLYTAIHYCKICSELIQWHHSFSSAVAF